MKTISKTIFTDERKKILAHTGLKSQAQVIEARLIMRELCEALKVKPARALDWAALMGDATRPACADHCTMLVEHNPECPRTYQPKAFGILCHIYSDGIDPEQRHADARSDAAAVGLAWLELPFSVYDAQRCISGIFTKIPRRANEGNKMKEIK